MVTLLLNKEVEIAQDIILISMELLEFGEKHALLGQIVVAKIVLKNHEAVESVKKRVRLACLSQLAPFKVPAKVILAEGVLHSARQKKIRRV